MSDWAFYRVGQKVTDWDQYSLDDIWYMVNEHIDQRNWDQTWSWHTMAVLCQHHADLLRKAADALTQHWSPAKSPAAQEFVLVVDRIVKSMQAASVAAHANAGALGRVITALLDARMEIEGIREQRQQAAVTPVPLSRGARSPSWDADFHDAAHKVMMLTDVTIADAHVDFREPPEPARFGSERSTASPVADPIPSGGHVAPLLATSPPARSLLASPLAASFTPHEPVPPGLPSPIGRVNTLGLPDGAADASLAGSAMSTTMVGPDGFIGAAPGKTPDGTQIKDVYAPVMPPSTPPVVSGGRAAATAGGRTGSQPTGMPFIPMSPPPGRQSGARVNPAGGLIGMGAPTISIRRRSHDPESPWAVEEGGPAVLLPPAEPEHHDPGPGVIGIDR